MSPDPPDPQAWRAWPAPPGVPPVPDPELLELLAADAAGRAAAMLTRTAVSTEDPLVDAVRLIATAAGAPYTAAVATRAGLPEDDVRRLVLAYRHGGTAGVSAARVATPGGEADLDAAVGEVRRRRAFSDRDLVVGPGEITDTGVRLRRGPDGRWYPFTLAREHWVPAAGANASAGLAYQAAVRAKALRGADR